MDAVDDLFELAIKVVLSHEGGYVNDPTDSGGETKFGISKRSYPALNISSLTIEQAKNIYKRDFWDKQPYKSIADAPIAIKGFDAAINMGASSANKCLQQAVGNLKEDGVLGPISLDAINSEEPEALLSAFKGKLADYYKSLVVLHPKNERFINGWLRRAYS